MGTYRMAGEENLRFVVRSRTQDSGRIEHIQHYQNVFDKDRDETVGGDFNNKEDAHNWANALQFAEWSKDYQIASEEESADVDTKESFILELRHRTQDGHRGARRIVAYFFVLEDGTFEITFGHITEYSSYSVAGGVYNDKTARIIWSKLVENFGFKRVQ